MSISASVPPSNTANKYGPNSGAGSRQHLSRQVVAARRFLVVFLVLVLYEGALRKWMFPEYGNIIFVLKDLLLLASALLLIAQGTLNVGLFKGTALPTAIFAYVAWVFLETFNSVSPSFTLSLIGARGYILYILVVPLCMATFKDSDDVMKGLRMFFILALPILVLGIAQFYSPVDALVNRYVRQDQYGPSTFGAMNYVRVTGTFSYITGMTTLLFATTMLAIADLGGERWKTLGRGKLSGTVLLLALFVVPMTGSRWSAYILVAVVPALWLFYRRGGLSLVALIRILFIGAVVAYALTQYGQDSVQAFQERASGSGDADQRYHNMFLGILDSPASGTLFGYGVGTTHQAAATIVPDVQPYSWIPDNFAEDELVRIAVESGLIGLVITLTMRLGLLFAAYRCALRATNMKQLFIAGTAVSYLLAYLFSNSVFNSTAGAFYWFYVGLLAVVWREQRSERAALGR